MKAKIIIFQLNSFVKPGIKTTEFWLTLAVVIIGGGVAFLAITYGSTVSHQIAAMIGVIVAFVKAHMYGLKRFELKAEEIYQKLHSACPPPVVVTPVPAPTPLPERPDSPTISLPIPENGSDSIELDIIYKYNVKKKPKLP